MSDNNDGTGGDQNGSSKKRKSDGTGPSPRGKKLTNDLLETLENPDLCDVTLIGSDGGRVPAIRVYLSARSEVLQHLLVGQFKEASEEEVRMGYPAAVLKALVHFCCTDEIPDTSTLDDDMLTSVRLALKLAEAADYYGLTLLKQKTISALIASMNGLDKKKSRGLLCCTVFEEVSRKPSLEGLKHHFYEAFRKDPAYLVAGERPGVTLLSSTNLRTIMDDPTMAAQAPNLFLAIKLWHKNEVPVEKEVLESQEERKDFAKQLASNLELRMISPNYLLGPVSESGLIEHSTIIQALQSQSSFGVVGIYGCQVDGLEVNGIYEEIPINSRFEAVPAGDPTRTLKIKRFDKKAAPGSNETNLSILSFCQAPTEGSSFPPGVSMLQSFRILAPPIGAANLVLTGVGLEKLYEDNRLLYVGDRPVKPNAKYVGFGIKWKVPPNDTPTPAWQAKRLPKMIIGPKLSTEPCIPPGVF